MIKSWVDNVDVITELPGQLTKLNLKDYQMIKSWVDKVDVITELPATNTA